MMRALIQMAGYYCFSVLVYFFLFGFIIEKPLTIGFVKTAYDIKFNYANKIDRSKIIIAAASNGLFSFRCETIEEELGNPCVNASIGQGLGLGFVLGQVKKMMRTGDTILMPMEFALYTQSRSDLESGAANAFIVAYDKGMLLNFEPTHMLKAVFYFDFKYLLSGFVEMTLKATGVSRRFNAGTLTPQGDMRNHTIKKAKAYNNFIKNLEQQAPLDLNDFLNSTHEGEIVVRKFLEYTKKNGIKVIGMLPTIFDDYPISEKVVQRISDIFVKNGHDFLMLPNRSQYPRDCFYDTSYHLNEPCQKKHSRLVAEALKSVIFTKGL